MQKQQQQSNNLELQILQASYWEHFKYEKELHYILPINHPKFKVLLDEINHLSERINKLKKINKCLEKKLF